jgi:transposase
VELNLQTIQHYNQMIAKLEWYIYQNTQQAHPQELSILMSVRGIGRILAQTIILEIDTIERFPAVQNFISYSRLVKCSHESAGKKYGCGGAKIGNPYLKHAFSEAAIFVAKFNPRIGERLEKLEQRYGKSKGKSILAARIGRAVYAMLKHKRVFDEQRFLSN